MGDIYQEPWPCGITITSKKEFVRLQDKVGKVKCVVVTNLVTNPLDVETIVVGDQARLHLDGFSMAYRGEGPHGLLWLLKELNIPHNHNDIFSLAKADTIIFSVQEECDECQTSAPLAR